MSSSSELVQDQATNAEINSEMQKRIAQKRAEIDENNQREFTAPARPGDATCARVGAADIQRHRNLDTGALSSSHVPAVRMDNVVGTYLLPHGVEERVASLEAHLGMENRKLPLNFMARIKEIEDRILALERIDPDYFIARVAVAKQITAHPNLASFASREAAEAASATSATTKRPADETLDSTDSIESRIKELTQTLRDKKQKRTKVDSTK
ncbi:hypothetical protein CAOG_03766 [Capsaspora owczarzaki ATCC 30864]|uniref:Uncharacterized protein n=1 Tax=Capsaspora owczarzaki (strain ATCC 30864) TaxID=595528 RepID=A0A0D2UCU2_CAPO3|nr:hypothetical protein CAOG_03766 [Capsaspora owczarzaki ATCC 30864]KJE92876.1 hypothetical protein CAOG_003766 [Capsaspora owczarzaki ATCC 30864]|eukprot:XP_004363494.1 hypothetical protein CAOG_03766 [Capsaspora owczarzaki ATCC 30864]